MTEPQVDTTVRYVGWPLEQLREILPGAEWKPTQYGISYQVTKTTRILIPWSRVIDIQERQRPVSTLMKPKTKKLIVP
jgi:hypothetical protein